MKECGRTEEMTREGLSLDKGHVRECRDCRDATIVHAFFRRLAAADDLAPSLPDPRLIALKADLIRQRRDLQGEGEGTRWLGVGIWATIAVVWLIVLTSRLGEIQSLLERFGLTLDLPGGAMATSIMVAAVGGLVAFTVFAVAVHSVIAEM